MANGTPVAPRDVKIMFAGLFFFSFTEQYAEGHVGIFPTPRGHDLCLNLIERGGDHDIRIYQNALAFLPKQITIEKRSGSTAEPADVTLLGGWTRPDEATATAPGHCKPFGWLVDFDALHPNGITIDNASFLSVLRFKTGEFFTAGIGKESFDLKHPASGASHLGPIASIIGVRITLTDTQDLVFGDAGSLSWILPHTISEVWLDDTCPGDLPATASEDNDMQEYYPLLGVPKSERLKFVAKETPLNSEPFVCYPGGGRKPRSLV